MKKINWHNPANATPPEGYRLLIPEEVDGRHRGEVDVIICNPREEQPWTGPSDTLTAKIQGCTYAVPHQTPLPEGYAVIDGEPWQMDGWTLHTPGDVMYVKSHIQADAVMEVRYRNGEQCIAPKRQHCFGQIKNTPGADIIGWRVVEQEKAPETKPMTATEIMEQHYPKDRAADRAWAASHLMMQQLEDFRTVLAENQRLKNELADARATINAIKSLLP